jgi:AcrR family transcriptional regulator
VRAVTRRTAELRLDALLRTACEVIVARGLANTRTADVAQAAGVSQALVFYHFATKERLLAQAFAYAAEQDLARLDALGASSVPPLEKLRKVLRLSAPSGGSTSWKMWIDGWSEAMRNPELERVARRLDLRWQEALTEVIAAGVDDGSFKCDDPNGASWRIHALIDGLAVQVTVHPRVISRREFTEWVRLATARELGIEPDQLA